MPGVIVGAVPTYMLGWYHDIDLLEICRIWRLPIAERPERRDFRAWGSIAELTGASP